MSAVGWFNWAVLLVSTIVLVVSIWAHLNQSRVRHEGDELALNRESHPDRTGVSQSRPIARPGTLPETTDETVATTEATTTHTSPAGTDTDASSLQEPADHTGYVVGRTVELTTWYGHGLLGRTRSWGTRREYES